MAERGSVIRADGDRNTLVIGRRRGDGPPDIPPAETPSNRDPSTATRYLTANRAQVELTVNANGATVPVILGGPLPVGGYVIFQKQTGGFYYIDFAICEGPLETIGSVTNITIDGKSSATLGATFETHTGQAGDTTSTLIGGVEGSYTIPEGIVHVAVKLPWPNPTSGDYNPFAFRATVTGVKTADLVGGGSAATSTNPVRCAHACLTSTVFGAGFNASTDFVSTEWSSATSACDYDVDPGAPVRKRWELSLRIDQQASVESWVTQILDHCNGHLRHDGEKWGIWLDLPRSVAQAGGADILFTDTGAAANLSARPTIVEKARAEIPTVVIVDYTDAAAGYIDSSVQVPANGPSGDWIEKRFSRPGITTIERARRMATFLYNVNQLARDISFQAWMTGALPLEGDRVLLQSARVIPADQTPPNVSGATAGVEHVVITDQTVTPTGVTLRASLYRDNTFSDTIDTSGGPTPPGQTPNAPDAPTNLVLTPEVTWENDVLVARIKIEWDPAAEPYSSFTRILYSRDGVNFNELGTGYQVGPVYLENAVMEIEHTFRLYTVRTATGQMSSALEDSVIPEYVDQSIPDVTQGLIYANSTLEFYGPIPSVMLAARNKAPLACSASPASGGITPTGSWQVAFSRVTAEVETHLSSPVSVTLDSSHKQISISGITDSDAAGGGTGVLFKKVYVKGPGWSDFNLTAAVALGSTTLSYNSAATFDSEKTPPATLDGVDHWNVYDDFGSPSEPPLYRTIPVLSPPQRYAKLPLGPIVHADPTTGLPRVDLIVAVVDKRGARSAGKSYSNTGVGWPQMMAQQAQFNQRSLTLANGDNNNVNIGGTATNIVTGPSGAFAITGIGGGIAGLRVTIINGTAQTMTVKHDNGSSSAANRIYVPGAADKAFANQHAAVEFEYDAAASRWRLIGT